MNYIKRLYLFAIISCVVASATATSQKIHLGNTVYNHLHQAGKALGHKRIVMPDSLARGVAPVRLNDWYELDYDSIMLEPSYLFMPLIFEKQSAKQVDSHDHDNCGFSYDHEWLDDVMSGNNRVNNIRYNAMINSPYYAPYNVNSLPEPPKSYIIVNDPIKNLMTVKEVVTATPVQMTLEKDPINYKHWLHSFRGSLHFSQAYVSSTWYQGGNNNLNALMDVAWVVKLNQKLHPKLLFQNEVSYRVGISAAPQDTLRSYSISEDLFKVNTDFGVKAFNHWYYSASLLFQTQILNNYPTNSPIRKASFRSPGELNIGIGMTYNIKSKDGWRTFDLSLSPLAYNLKACRDIVKVDPTAFGIPEGKHTYSSFGSKIDAKWLIKFSASISWISHLYAFTNYKNVVGDWENTVDFSITSHLTTKIFVHLRYDSSTDASLSKWKHWQLKEILSFGLAYKFGIE